MSLYLLSRSVRCLGWPIGVNRRGSGSLSVAERLYGSEGVANVSLRQIRIGAGQRNDAAVQYHFGDRDGIIGGLTDRHLPRIQAITRRVLEAAGHRPSMRQLVDTLVRPWAEYTTLGPSEHRVDQDRR